MALVGVGPRGLSVLERLLIRLRSSPYRGEVTVWAVDPVEHGSGRVWRTGQPWWLTMNATGAEVTVRSPDSDVPGGGLVEWSNQAGWPHETVGPVDYPPRRVYGAYLKDTFDRMRASAPRNVRVRPVLGEVTEVTRMDGRYLLTVDTLGTPLRVDKVVLATGHGAQQLSDEQRRLADHGEDRYLAESIAADMPLDAVAPSASVAIRGLGLSFYDIVRSLSIGRGGRFVRDQSGRLAYRPSGAEPRITAGSRSGVPFLARPRFDEAPETAPRPTVLTEQRLDDLRTAAFRNTGTSQLDFAKQVEPLIMAEARSAHASCAGRQNRTRLGVRVEDVGQPFRGKRFSSPQAFRLSMMDMLRTDVEEARKGPHGSPVKAATEMLRGIRPLLPSVVDYGGLLPGSHRDFLSRFAPWSFIVSAGPPDEHVEQLLALIDAGVVDVVGPAARFEPDKQSEGFTVESGRVAGSRRTVDVLIEARVPVTDIRRSAAPLTQHLLADGVISEFVNTDPITGEQFASGGLAITPPPCRVINDAGVVNPDIYAIGVATEKTRWFTQVGTGRPGKDSPFCREADAIAGDIMSSLERDSRELPW
ncbi:hypothetical protein ALI144C_01850 [Actinosynnema sp. ALI-1.44]|nr:hypothetical protein ALI144C_01850 [Actinosynnema sp. ALI-1.44]